MSSGVSMHAMTRNVPPHTAQCSMSMRKTRSSRCIQRMGAGRDAGGRAGGWVDRVGDDAVAVLEVRGEHAVVPGEMGAGAWNEGGEAGDEVDGVEHDMSGAVPEGVFEPIHDLPAVIDREAFVGDGRAGDVAAQAFEGVPVTGWAARAGMEGESRELGDAEVVGRRVGADGAQRQCLAPGVGAGGDAVVDGGAEELFETVGGFDVEGRGLVGAGQQPLLFQSAGDTGGDGVEQALEFGLCRCGDAASRARVGAAFACPPIPRGQRPAPPAASAPMKRAGRPPASSSPTGPRPETPPPSCAPRTEAPRAA